MPSIYPGAPDDLSAGNTALNHGDVSDAVAAIEATLGVNPQGEAADVAARLDAIGDGVDGRTILSGSGAPASGSGLDPFDGVNDPWRWNGTLYGGWIGPAFEVTVVDGATIDVSTETPAGAETDLVVTSATTIAASNTGPLVGGNTTYSFGNPGGTATADGTGIAFLIQYETGYAGPTTLPDATLNLAAVLAAHSTGVTVGAPYTFADVQTGVDGDFYIDTAASNLYGPKAGTWPAPVSLIGPAGADGGTGDLGPNVDITGSATNPDDPPSGTVRLTVRTNEGFSLGPSVRVVNSEGWPADLATFDDIGATAVPLSMYRGTTGTLLTTKAADPTEGGAGADVAFLTPGTDGQVLTAQADGVNLYGQTVGLAWTDPHIITSPLGVQYRLVVDEAGALSTEAV